MDASQKTAYDVVVVGSGVLGLAVAWRLSVADPALRICVVAGPGGRHGSAASSAAGAMLGSVGEVVYDTLQDPLRRKKFELELDAVKRWGQWLPELCATAGAGQVSARQGTFMILNAAGGLLDEMNFDAVLAAADEYQVKWETVAPKDVPGLAPAMAARPLKAAYLPDDGWVDSGQLLDVLAAACVRSGVAFVEQSVAKLDISSSRIAGVTRIALPETATQPNTPPAPGEELRWMPRLPAQFLPLKTLG